MQSIIDQDGAVRLGRFVSPVDEINCQDWNMTFSSGRSVPGILKKFRYKTFHFAGIATSRILAGAAIADIGYLSSCFAYVYDLEIREFREIRRMVPGFGKASIRQTPETPSSVFQRSGMSVIMDSAGLSIKAGGLDFKVGWMEDPELMPLRLCTRSGYTGWAFTRKASPVKVSGQIRSGNRMYDLDPDGAFAITDWTGGFLRRETWWNWAAIAGMLPDGRTLGLNLAWGTNETGFTENVFWLDSAMTKVDAVCFREEIVAGRKQWAITSTDGRVNLVFVPENQRAESVNAVIVASRFTQFFGRFSGTLVTGDGLKVAVSGIPGWAEDHFARW